MLGDTGQGEMGDVKADSEASVEDMMSLLRFGE